MNRPSRTVMGAARPATAGLRALAVVVLVPALVACGPGTGDPSPSPTAGPASSSAAPGVGGGDDDASPAPSATGSAPSGGTATTPPEPPGASEPAAGEDGGQGGGEDAGAPAADDRAPADVVITYSAWSPDAAEVQVGAYVADVLEDGGVCTLRLVRGDRTVTTEAGGAADATLTGCGALAVGGAALSTGRWTGTVEYSSNTSTGVSAPVEIEVP